MKKSAEIKHDTCYYCGEFVEETYWNAGECRTSSGRLMRNDESLSLIETETHWPCHKGCLRGEEDAIRRAGEWARGQRFEDRHMLPNPLGYRVHVLECGCIFSLMKDEPDGQEHFSGMNGWCPEHERDIRDKTRAEENGFQTVFIPFVIEELKEECPGAVYLGIDGEVIT